MKQNLGRLFPRAGLPRLGWSRPGWSRLGWSRLAAALLGVALLLPGCAPPPSTRAPSTLINSTAADASTLLPTLTVDTTSSFVTSLIFDGLAVYDDQLNPHPALAESWEVEEDRIYTFHIRQGVKFHDGTRMTADDAVFTFLTIAHPHYQGVRFGDFAAVKGWQEMADAYEAADAAAAEGRITEAERQRRRLGAYEQFVQTGGLQAPDEYTFRVEAAYPFAPLFSRLTGYGIMPKHLLESELDDLAGSAYASSPVGTGSMRLVSWQKGKEMVLERNPDWRYSLSGEGGKIDRMIIKVEPDQQTRMAALEKGEADMADIPPEMVEHFRANVPQVQIYDYSTFAYTFLGYNLQHPAFGDRRVRQAITHALDRQAMIQQLLAGQGRPVQSHGSPDRWDYNPDVPILPYDPVRAAALLDEARWLMGPDGWRQKDGQTLSMEIAVNVENRLREQTAIFIQEALQRAGIQVTIRRLAWDAFLAHISSDAKEAYLLGWSLGFDPDPHSIFHSEGGFQAITGYANPEVDRLISEGRSTTDQAQRKEIYGRLQELLAEEQVYSWLFLQDSVVGLNQRVQGVRHGSPRGLMWNWEEWHVNLPPSGAE